MPGRAAALIEIPATLWQRAAMTEALRNRDMGRVFRLVRQYTGASQTQLAIACGMTQGKISDIMRDVQRVIALDVFERIADGLNMPDPARTTLGLAPAMRPAEADTAASQQARRSAGLIPPRDAPLAMGSLPVPGPLTVDLPDGEEDPVRRRTFVSLTGASLFGAVMASTGPGGTGDAVEAFAAVLAGYSPDDAADRLDTPPGLKALGAAVASAKRDYQACRYSQVLNGLPDLLTSVQTACTVLAGERQSQAYTLSAEAHHVAGSILLKLGEHALAGLAADRSIQAARCSGDPLTVGSSARIVTHALASSGHRAAAASTASGFAQRLDRGVPTHDGESLSVYGSLLLRGAIAAAQRNDRHTAHELLNEAEDAGRRLGPDANLRWTAFGPTNVTLHRVNIAVTLGDAGAAIDVARTVNLDQVTVTERKVSLLIDTARAFLQYGKHENAYLALRASRDIAPEEIAGRPAARQLVRDLITSAPPSVQRQAEDFAQRLGVSR
jgi:transcriptional regulator with XRE-family HTH domain